MSQVEIDRLVARRDELHQELGEVQKQLNAFRVKCSGCRCRILPGTTCGCCASFPEIAEDEHGF